MNHLPDVAIYALSVPELQNALIMARAHMRHQRAKMHQMRRSLRQLNRAHATLWKVIRIRQERADTNEAELAGAVDRLAEAVREAP